MPVNLWRRESRWRKGLRALGDAAAAVAALAGAFWVRIHLPLPFTAGLLPGARLQFLQRDWVLALLFQFASLYFFGFYDRPQPRTRAEALRLLAGAAALQAAALLGYFFFTFRSFPRSVLLLYVLFDLLLLLAWRSAVDRAGRHRERQ